MVEYRNLNNAMETGDHSKNGASLKSQMSRGNFLRKACFAVLAVAFGFSAIAQSQYYSRKKDEPVVRKIWGETYYYYYDIYHKTNGLIVSEREFVRELKDGSITDFTPCFFNHLTDIKRLS